MSAQREKPIPAATAAWLAIRMARDGDGSASGGQIENFRTGWAFPVLGDYERAHFFVRKTFTVAQSLCGVRADPERLFGAGNFPQCQLCLKKKSSR